MTVLQYLRSEWRAIASFMVTVLVVVFLATLLSGCSSPPGGSGLLGWWTGRGERAAAKAETRHDAAREAQLAAARLEAEKTARAADALPASPEAALTQRFAGNTTDLLAQAVPGVTAEQLAAVRQLVADLRSQDAAIVAAAEKRQAATETANHALSRELGAAAVKLADAEARASDIAATNARLAGQMLALKWAAGIGTALTIASTVAALAYRANAFGMADGVARGLADLRKRQPGIAKVATGALDAGLNRAEQSRIALLAQKHLATT